MADSSSSNPTAVDQFILITNADPATARFFLSATNGDCDAAVSAFFESDGLIPSSAATATPAAAPLPPPPPPPPQSSSSAAAPARRAAAPAAAGGPGRIATLGSLARAAAAAADDDDEENDPGYYAGGEKSGQMIQDPRKHNNRPSSSSSGGNGSGPSSSSRINTLNNDSNNNNNNNNAATGLADAILQQAQARSRDPGLDAERAEFDQPQLFTGAGYRLGNTAADAPTRPTVIGRRNVTRVLTLYANGFTVDDGPLRRFDDPTNEEFLADVNRGVVPKEMEQPDIGDVSITLVDRKGTDYDRKRHGGGGTRGRGGVAGSSGVVLGGRSASNNNSTGGSGSNSRRMAGSIISNGSNVNGNNTTGNGTSANIIPFSGGGNLLSSSTTNNTSDTDTQMHDTETNVPTVDNNAPTARVQVRLVDGSRLVATLNMTHTVGDLRHYVRAQQAAGLSQRFVLATTFPRVVLSDDKMSIAEAKLNGAVVVQSLK